MKVVIDIDNDLYNFVVDKKLMVMDLPEIEQAIRHGTVLPKGHGDLIDRNYFIDKYAGCGNVYCEDASCKDCNSRIVNKFDVDSAPAIISADDSEVD